jgi:succinoglycan biosynthesis protein ExoM
MSPSIGSGPQFDPTSRPTHPVSTGSKHPAEIDTSNEFVSVCTITYKRPIGLESLLRSVACLRFERIAPPRLEVIVVDNDPGCSAEAIVRRLAAIVPWPVRYVHEPRRGIPMARNRALSSIDPQATLAALLDDDEFTEPTWLEELLLVQRAYAADVVAGPVVPVFGDDVPMWMRPSFDRPRRPTGTELAYASTNNVLFRHQLLRKWQLAFRELKPLAGGEDTRLFLRMKHRGAKIVWANSAIVFETVPPTRANVRWILKRAYRVGTTWSSCEREFDPRLRTLALRVVKASGRMVQGTLMVPWGVLRGRKTLIRGGRYVAWGVGNLAGLLGVTPEEYKQVHGG